MKGDGSDTCCCYMCSHAPLVIISSGEAICDQYSIRLRNVREFIDGGLLAVRKADSKMLALELTNKFICFFFKAFARRVLYDI